jgi:hypothetical protein
MVSFLLRSLALTFFGVLAGCSYVSLPSMPATAGPSYYAARNETASVESIELAFADGKGVGAFMSAIDPAPDAALAASQRYRVKVIFDSGNHTTLVQDGTIPLAIGQRIKIEGGRAVPTDQPDTPHLPPTTLF